MNYKHLSQKERDQIFELLQVGYSKSEIAKFIDRNPSTISRELMRNSVCVDRKFNGSPLKKKKRYLPDTAQIKYEDRRKNSKSVYPLKNSFIHSYVICHLKIGWSPEIISGKIKNDHNQ